VDNMNYMYSLNANNGELKLYVNFDVQDDPNIDQVLSQMRKAQATRSCPPRCATTGHGSRSPRLRRSCCGAVLARGSYDATFLANYAYINLSNQLTRVPGSPASPSSAPAVPIRMWVKPDQLAKLNITCRDRGCHQTTETVNPPPGGGDPRRRARSSPTPSAPGPPRGPGSLPSSCAANRRLAGATERRRAHRAGIPNLLIVRPVERQPAAILALYQLPGSNAIAAVTASPAHGEGQEKLPSDLEYSIPLTRPNPCARHQGDHHDLYEALILSSSWCSSSCRAARHLIRAAVPVSLVGTFAMSDPGLFHQHDRADGLVLAIGLVVDDAIVVVEAVEHTSSTGFRPRRRRSRHGGGLGPSSPSRSCSPRFLPTVFIPGITASSTSIRSHHRHLGHHLGFQRPDAEPRASS